MIYELRLILLGICAVLMAGLWWWEQRRSRTTHDLRDERPSERHEPRIDDDGARRSDELPFGSDPEPIVPTRFGSADRLDPGLPPPVITIDDLPDDVGDVDLVSADDGEIAPAARVAHGKGDDLPPASRHDGRRAPVGVDPPIREFAEDDARGGERFAAVSPPASAAVRVPEPGAALREAPAARPPAQEPAQETPARQGGIEQRIVAIRMAAGRLPPSGRALLAALDAESLEFGRYAIFHRLRADGGLLFSVASLREPGSFDIDQMAGQSFPGVSLFAVFPGPVDAAQVFDDMLATARRLADRLGGTLQDERGVALSAQKILSIREELSHFQDLVNQTRDRGGV